MDARRFLATVAAVLLPVEGATFLLARARGACAGPDAFECWDFPLMGSALALAAILPSLGALLARPRLLRAALAVAALVPLVPMALLLVLTLEPPWCGPVESRLSAACSEPAWLVAPAAALAGATEFLRARDGRPVRAWAPPAAGAALALAMMGGAALFRWSRGEHDVPPALSAAVLAAAVALGVAAARAGDLKS